jgi:UDP-glucose 4-epimerase
MKVVIFGGTGFVGLNLAGTLLSRGHHVTLYDRTQLPATAARSLADYGERLRVVQGDITDTKRIEALIAEDCDTIVLGAAITAGAHLARTNTKRILKINVMAQIPILSAATRHRVRRVINLSSAAAYGAAGRRYAYWMKKRPATRFRFMLSANSRQNAQWRGSLISGTATS